ncbi:MAG: Mov34/MPN/PAD-1 family protein [Planctomycetota bacterium]
MLPVDQLREFMLHIKAASPREASGLLLAREYRRFTVLFFVGTSHEENTPSSFRIRDVVIGRAVASLQGSDVKVCGCGHSHNRGKAIPSNDDYAAIKGPCTLWMIYSVPHRDLKMFSWDGAVFHKERFQIIF